MFFNIAREKGNKTCYHIEFQTKNDSTMVIRTFEYGFKKANETSDNDEEIKTLYFPKQKVIFFEENNNIKDELKLKIIFPDDKEILYTVGVIKYWELTEEELIKRKMYPLLPLKLFNLRKDLAKAHKKKDIDKLKELSKVARDLSKKLAEESRDLFEQDKIFGEDFHKMLVSIQNLIEYLNKNYLDDEKIQDEVVEMTKTLYDPRVHEQGRIEGILEGKLEGRLEGKLEAVKESINDALNELGEVYEDLEKFIQAQSDLDTLKKWFKISLRCDNIDEFERKIGRI